MKTLYRGPLYRVIHSAEEEAECLADGWLPTPEDGKQYIVHTAIQAPTSCFAPSIEAEKREAPAAGFCPEPEQGSCVMPDAHAGQKLYSIGPSGDFNAPHIDDVSLMQMSTTECAEMTDLAAPSEPVEAKSKSARRKSAKPVKPNDNGNS